MGDEQAPEMQNPAVGATGFDEQTTKSSALTTTSTPEQFSPQIRDQFAHVAAFHNYSWSIDEPWSRDEIVNLLGSKIANVYTTTSLLATSSEDLIRILYAHSKLDAVYGSDLSGRAAAERERDEVRASIPTLRLNFATLADEETLSAPQAARRSRARPTIEVTTDQKAVVDAAEQALLKRGGIYVRGRTLVRVVYDKGSSDWLRRPEGMPVVVALAGATLSEILSSCAVWIKLDSKGVPYKVRVPSWVVETLMARGEWTLPWLEGVTDTPVMRPDGTILDRPGYDPTTRLIYEPDGSYPNIPANPTLDDARTALAVLLDPFCDICFDADHDRAATAAFVLSIVARPMIDGDVPMFGVTAPTPGSGKGLVTDLVSLITTGRAFPGMSHTENEDETRKRLLALAIEAPSLIVLDNVEGQLGSAVLAMAITRGEVKDRVLGVNETVTATLRAVWGYNGNNVGLKGDLGRRVVEIRLDPRMEHPEDRTGPNEGKAWTHPDVKAHVIAIRPALVVAALTLLRAYVVAKRPAHGKPPKGSFESWDRLVRGAIIWAGGADPLGGTQRIRDEGDSDLDNLRTLLGAWHARYGSTPKTVREVIADATMREALGGYSPAKGDLGSVQLSGILRRLKGRPAGGLRLERGEVDKTTNVVAWKVVRI